MKPFQIGVTNRDRVTSLRLIDDQRVTSDTIIRVGTLSKYEEATLNFGDLLHTQLWINARVEEIKKSQLTHK